MKGFYKFITIYKTTLIKDQPQKIISDPITIEIFKGARSYKILHQLSNILPADEDTLASKEATLVLDEKSYHIEFTARTKEENPYLARKICEDEIDRIITILSIIYKPDIFDSLIYHGWLWEVEKGMSDAWIKRSEKIQLNGKLLTAELISIKKNQSKDPDVFERFSLMSRFYSKSLPERPSEEKFLLLWTILEIFPMKATSNIRPISEYLASITGQQPEIVKEKLGIGRLYGHRCSLVHNGKLDIDIKEMGDTFIKLENIVYEVLRGMSGIPYSGSLDKYLY